MPTVVSRSHPVSPGADYGCYRETSPDWINYAVLLNGYRVPDTAARFRYLELDCGQGLGLCLLAATYPHAEFLGVDFNPEHVSAASALAQSAGLGNLRFEVADFPELATRWPADFGQFHYVTLQGIYSRISQPLRKDAVKCLAAATRPGALVCTSYDALPGLMSAMPLQDLLLRLQSGRPGPHTLQQGMQLVESLTAAKSAMRSFQPQRRWSVDNSRNRGDTSSQGQDPAREPSQPLWFSQVADELACAGLDHVGSATLPENDLPVLLGEKLANVVRAGEGRVMQQALQDMAINQSFRRDIFCRGPRESRNGMAHLDEYTLTAGAHLSRQSGEVATTFGHLKLPGDLLDAVVDRLQQGPARIADLRALDAFRSPKRADTVQVTTMRLHAMEVFRSAKRGDALQMATLLLHAGRVNLAPPQSAQDSLARFSTAVALSAIRRGTSVETDYPLGA
jgi:hypothetical protein